MSTLVDEPGHMRLYSGCMSAKGESSLSQPMPEPSQLYFEACFLGQSPTNWAFESFCGLKMRPLEISIFAFLGGTEMWGSLGHALSGLCRVKMPSHDGQTTPTILGLVLVCSCFVCDLPPMKHKQQHAD